MWYSVEMFKASEAGLCNPAKIRVTVFAGSEPLARGKAEFLHPDYIASKAFPLDRVESYLPRERAFEYDFDDYECNCGLLEDVE